MVNTFNPCDYPTCFLFPNRLVLSAWLEHIPFGLALVEMTRPRVLVELGTYYGASYFAFCQAIARLQLNAQAYAIDTWAGDPHCGFTGPEVFEEVRAHHDQYYSGFSRLVRSTFNEALPYFGDGSIDLLHIDGYHTYDEVKDNFKTWLPKLSDRGVVLVHDINVRENQFGVWRFWDEVKKAYPSFDFAHQHGLGVLAIGREAPEPLSRLLATTDDERGMIRTFYAQLGRRISAIWERNYIHKDFGQLYATQQAAAAQHQAAIDAMAAQHRAAVAAREQEHQTVFADRQRTFEAALAAAVRQHGEQLHQMTLERQAVLAAETSNRTAMKAAFERRLAEQEETLQIVRAELAQAQQFADRWRAEMLIREHQEKQLRDRLQAAETAHAAAAVANAALHREMETSKREQGETVRQQREELQRFQRDLERVRASLAFRLARKLSLFAQRVAPPSSWRGQLLRVGRRGAAIVHREGILSLPKRAIQQIRPRNAA